MNEPLSPVAQAVMDVTGTSSLQWSVRPIAAAALRAAADQIEDLYCDSDVGDSDGVVFALRQLRLIADELDLW